MSTLSIPKYSYFRYTLLNKRPIYYFKFFTMLKAVKINRDLNLKLLLDVVPW